MALLGTIVISQKLTRMGSMLASCGRSSSGAGAIKSQDQRMHGTTGEATAVA